MKPNKPAHPKTNPNKAPPISISGLDKHIENRIIIIKETKPTSNKIS